MRNLLQILLFTFFASNAFAGYYSTLPKGVRAFEFRHIFTSDIGSLYNNKGVKEDIYFKENLNAEILSSVNTATKVYFEELKALSPEAHDEFSFGEYQAEGSANVDVQVVGGGVGITDRLTAYFGFPIFDAEVNLDIRRTKGNNHARVANILERDAGDSDTGRILSQLTGQLPDATGELLQGVMVNMYGYKPVGSWNAQGMGDTELGLMYRLAEWDYSGLMVVGGLNLPTGREDDPDIIQDIAFGDGQTDIFGEFGGGFVVPKYYFGLDSFFRYTYQLPTKKNLRIPDTPGIPIGRTKGDFVEKLGNKFDFNIQGSFFPNDWLTVFGGYIYSHQGQSKYQSNNQYANEALALDTMIETHTLLGGMEFSTVNLFKRGKFWAPLSIAPSIQRIVKGVNSPSYTRYNLKFRLFF